MARSNNIVQNYTEQERINILGQMHPGYESILSKGALEFVASLNVFYGQRRAQLLIRRQKIQERINKGVLPNFLPETEYVRNSDWTIGIIPEDLQRRRVEITGPVDRKMVINALNSGADVYMADFEDSHSPTWTNTVQGQINLRDAINRTIEYVSPEGKQYRLKDQVATLLVRPRGLHLYEKHVTMNGQPVPAGFFDYGIFLYNNMKQLAQNQTAPYFYLPKLENHVEARLWNDIFNTSEELLELPRNTIKCSVLIENILAAFEMEEILFELKDHITALNFGRWDYIFSMIKKLGKNQDFLLPDRSQLDMTTHFLTSCALLLVKTAHKRGAYAVGGMAANIPVKSNVDAQKLALSKVVADKEREAEQGFDGAWVAHPGLVPLVMEIFRNKLRDEPNQLHVKQDNVQVTARNLLFTPKGSITENGVRTNISVSLQYLSSWLAGNGCVAINGLMEDAATVEISRAQIWQWLVHEVKLSDGRQLSPELFRSLLKEEKKKLAHGIPDVERLDTASQLLDRLSANYEFTDFMTIPAYELLD